MYLILSSVKLIFITQHSVLPFKGFQFVFSGECAKICESNCALFEGTYNLVCGTEDVEYEQKYGISHSHHNFWLDVARILDSFKIPLLFGSSIEPCSIPILFCILR